MSPKRKQINSLNTIRNKLEMTSEKILREGGKITPHHIIEGLKDNDYAQDKLTCIGHLVMDSLSKRKMIENVSWIAFRFYFPGREFSYSEREMRNWVAVRSNCQKLLDTMHEVVREEFHDHQNIYAPSVLFPQMSESQSKNPELVKKFRKRWWLYKLADDTDEFSTCCTEELKDMKLISFKERKMSNGRAVGISFCPPVPEYSKTLTLGSLMKETEEVSLKKFRIFKHIVHKASEGEVFLNCDFYVRIPLFFRSMEQEYMTDIFVALSHTRKNGEVVSRLEIGDLIGILDDIVPSLKTCVSLLNGQVAYSFGEVTRRDKMAGLLHAVIRHDINNFASAVDISISQLRRYWRILKEDEAYEIIDEVRANIILSTMFIGLDFLWSPDIKDDIDNFVPINRFKEQLDNSWRFSSVLSCEFSGDWSSEHLVPKASRIIMSNLLRNAIDNNGDDGNAAIRLDCFLESKEVEFGCLSESAFSKTQQRKVFEAPLSSKIPKFNKGLWICRYTAKAMGSELYLGSGQGKYKTNIRFRVPIFETPVSKKGTRPYPTALGQRDHAFFE